MISAFFKTKPSTTSAANSDVSSALANPYIPSNRSTSSSASTNPVQKYIRRIASPHVLPRIDDNGIPFLTEKEGSNGKMSVAKRKKLETPLAIRKYLDANFPNRPFHITKDARHRIKRFKGSSSTFWTPKLMELACEEFKVPNGMKVIILNPDLFDRDLLQH